MTDNLRDAYAIAEARAALDRAERQMLADQAAEEMRAAEQALAADQAAFQAEVDAVAGPWDAVDAAQADIATLSETRRRILDDAIAASAALKQARAALPKLLTAPAAGDQVTPDDIEQARAGVARAERWADYLTDALAEVELAITQAEARLKAATAAAYVGVRQRGAQLRLQAAREVSEAILATPGRVLTHHEQSRLIPGTALDQELVAEARKTFDRGNRFLALAASKGTSMPPGGIDMTWPNQEIVERGRWKALGDRL